VPTILVGSEASTDNTANNPRDMDAPVHELEPNVAPFLLLLNKLKKKAATNPKIEWNEDEQLPRITTLTASAASNATTFVVAADYFRVGDVVRVTAGGWAFLVTATAANALSGTKVGGTAQASAANAAEVFIVSSANAEGATLREIKYTQLVTASNYAQILRTPLGITGTEGWTEHYGGPERKRLQNKKGQEHARDIENTLFFGARDLVATHQRMCGGVKEFLSTNVTNDSGGTTEAEWLTFLKTAFRYGSEEKWAFCSPSAISAIEGYARSNIKTAGSSDHASTYGIKMSQYVSGQGTVNLVKHKDWNDSSVYGGYVFLIDLDAVTYRPGRETKLKMDVHAPDYDGFKDEYLTEFSLQVEHERRHALLTGVS